jgi:GAF domain-containing protein
MSTAPQPNRRPAGNGLVIHVGAVIAFAVVAIVCALYTMVVTLPPGTTLVFAVLGLGAGACAVKIMESMPHQETLSKIGHAIAKPPVPPPPVAVTEIRHAPDDLLAIVSLVRFVDGEATFGDAAALATAPLSRILTDTTCAFYIHDPASGHLVARYVTGEHAAALRGISMPLGERLSGWVAACRQTITNSDAALDLYDRGVTLGSAISTPLVDGERVLGVFTAYAAAHRTFTDDQSRLVEMMAPHLGRIVGAALRSEQRTRDLQEPRAATPGTRDLRVVFSR